MNNADKPAYPDPMRGGDQAFYNQAPDELDGGLTKRERFALADWTTRELERAANEVCDRENGMDTNFDQYSTVNNIDVMIKARLLLADKLLKELEKDEKA